MGVDFIFYFIQFCIGVLQSLISFSCYLLPLKLLFVLKDPFKTSLLLNKAHYPNEGILDHKMLERLVI